MLQKTNPKGSSTMKFLSETLTRSAHAFNFEREMATEVNVVC